MNMTLRKINPTVGAAENLRLRMEAQEGAQGSDASKGGGLSAGATAGITIGVTLGVGILFIMIFIAIRRKNPPLAVNNDNGYQSFNNS